MTDAQFELLMLKVLEEIRGFRRDYNNARQPWAPDHPLVVAIDRAHGPGVFSTSEILRKANSDRELRQTLRRVLKRRTLTAQALGRRLGAIYKHPQTGRLRLQRDQRDGHGWLWSIVNVDPCSSPTPNNTINTNNRDCATAML